MGGLNLFGSDRRRTSSKKGINRANRAEHGRPSPFSKSRPPRPTVIVNVGHSFAVAQVHQTRYLSGPKASSLCKYHRTNGRTSSRRTRRVTCRIRSYRAYSHAKVRKLNAKKTIVNSCGCMESKSSEGGRARTRREFKFEEACKEPESLTASLVRTYSIREMG